MMKMTVKIFGIGVVLLVFSAMTAADSFAHPGGLNPIKCHFDNKASKCHCHIGESLMPADLAHCESLAAKEFTRSEADYTARLCIRLGGIIEVRLKSGKRVDCVTVSHAIESDFAPKWEDAIQQAQTYADETGKSPGILLVMKDIDDDRYLTALCQSVTDSSMPITVYATGVFAPKDGEINCAEFLNG